ncbi:MAG: hypothetical protein ABW171_01810 [Steroidobacter sp.]
MRNSTDRAGTAVALAMIASVAFAAEEQPAVVTGGKKEVTVNSFASDEDRLDGDHLKLRVNVTGFAPLDGAATGLCAPKESKLKVSKHEGDTVYLFFKSIPADVSGCSSMVNDSTQYQISATTLNRHAYRRTGVTFGALIVPFKLYLGDDSRLSASSTIAPYVGFRWLSTHDLAFTPVVSAGLGLVPVADDSTGETSTRSAFSTAVGVLLTHSKNEKFNAGLLVGKDFLSKNDREGDPAIDNLWFSLYAGYSL